MPVNSRNKGKRGEAEVAERLAALGLGEVEDCRQERCEHGLPDVGIPGVIAIEVKFREVFNAYKSMEQVEQKVTVEKHKTSLRCVYHRRKRQDWLVVLRANDFEKLITGQIGGLKQGDGNE